LIEPLRITPVDTSNHGEELNGSETIPPEETIDQQNPNSYVTTGRIIGDYYSSVEDRKSIKWDRCA
jgi:hypothetical protein